ncbi:hypothetical protein [Micromonospora sp. WMMD737]|uniref:hypothetical protein n=1 Tax=Micromonospora sp. WMMD737 TaxID=3404113 RepID=UPI003B944213
MSARKPLPERKLKAGDVVHLARAASPQFTKPIFVRVIREIPERHPPYGWLWFEGYQLDAHGAAVAKRELFVLREGVSWQRATPGRTTPLTRQPPSRTPVAVG